jgi:mannose-6-phosphate isomerase-like protein (cupin superfamily)
MRNKYLIRRGEGRNEPIKDLDGASREILVDAQAAAAEDITFGFSRFEPKTSVHKKHTHPGAEEIMYILKGRGMSGVVDQEFEVKAGDTLWVPRGAPHWFYNPFDEACEFVFLYTRSSLKDAGYVLAGEG